MQNFQRNLRRVVEQQKRDAAEAQRPDLPRR